MADFLNVDLDLRWKRQIISSKNGHTTRGAVDSVRRHVKTRVIRAQDHHHPISLLEPAQEICKERAISEFAVKEAAAYHKVERECESLVGRPVHSSSYPSKLRSSELPEGRDIPTLLDRRQNMDT